MLSNLLRDLPASANDAETFEAVLLRPDVKIERIVSTGQASPPDFWYCQPQSEWVLILQGAAGLQLEGEAQERVLQVGDFVNIPAHCRHRVNWTRAEPPTIWLAVHYEYPDGELPE
ncbi:cupin domain-containing protein [Kosakonia pseudosacchari]|uniref:cupin domain-containing protein n=1 Tax=Kosakonia pseudosacchari TaxID=1646340 RepID=UPI000A3C7864|nr:cupin domain-containing protein [Kosakonia pseudosacchari]